MVERSVVSNIMFEYGEIIFLDSVKLGDDHDKRWEKIIVVKIPVETPSPSKQEKNKVNNL